MKLDELIVKIKVDPDSVLAMNEQAKQSRIYKIKRVLMVTCFNCGGRYLHGKKHVCPVTIEGEARDVLQQLPGPGGTE